LNRNSNEALTGPKIEDDGYDVIERTYFAHLRNLFKEDKMDFPFIKKCIPMKVTDVSISPIIEENIETEDATIHIVMSPNSLMPLGAGDLCGGGAYLVVWPGGLSAAASEAD
jgi:hypothetical protein